LPHYCMATQYIAKRARASERSEKFNEVCP
jgi:hypothetical protein